MQIKQLFNDESAVSPVIGVILMVAITVILAAVIGTFVLGLGDQVSQAQPSANIGFAYDIGNAAGSDTIDVTHKGGDKLDVNTISVVVAGVTAYEEGAVNAGQSDYTASGWSTDVTAGDTLTIGEDAADTISNGQTVRVIWSADSGDTAIIAEGTVQ